MSDDRKISSCSITPANPAAGEYQAVVRVRFEGDPIDGPATELFRYYDDELHFTESEFLGLTKDQGGRVFLRKDVAYLQS
jgi:hypothetical protein